MKSSTVQLKQLKEALGNPKDADDTILDYVATILSEGVAEDILGTVRLNLR